MNLGAAGVIGAVSVGTAAGMYIHSRPPTIKGCVTYSSVLRYVQHMSTNNANTEDLLQSIHADMVKNRIGKTYLLLWRDLFNALRDKDGIFGFALVLLYSALFLIVGSEPPCGRPWTWWSSVPHIRWIRTD